MLEVGVYRNFLGELPLKAIVEILLAILVWTEGQALRRLLLIQLPWF